MQHESGQDGVCRLTWTARASRKHMLSRAGGQRETGAPSPECQIRKGPGGDSKAWLGMTKVMTASHDVPYIQHSIQEKNKIRYRHKHFS